MKSKRVRFANLVAEKSKEHMELKRKFCQVEQDLVNTSDQLFVMNKERMQLNNMMLELRGNIRVFVRVRPPMNTETEDLCIFKCVDDSSLLIFDNEPSARGREQPQHNFTFDKVFDPSTSQEEIFDNLQPGGV